MLVFSGWQVIVDKSAGEVVTCALFCEILLRIRRAWLAIISMGTKSRQKPVKTCFFRRNILVEAPMEREEVTVFNTKSLDFGFFRL